MPGRLRRGGITYPGRIVGNAAASAGAASYSAVNIVAGVAAYAGVKHDINAGGRNIITLYGGGWRARLVQYRDGRQYRNIGRRLAAALATGARIAAFSYRHQQSNAALAAGAAQRSRRLAENPRNLSWHQRTLLSRLAYGWRSSAATGYQHQKSRNGAGGGENWRRKESRRRCGASMA